MPETDAVLRRILVVMGVIAVILLAAGCAGGGDSLAGTRWQAQDYYDPNNAADMSTVLMDTSLTAEFGDDGQLSGSGGCNSYTGSYEADGDSLSIGPLGLTMMMCEQPEGIMDQEMAFLSALQSADSQARQGEQLHILNDEGQVVVVFNPQ